MATSQLLQHPGDAQEQADITNANPAISITPHLRHSFHG